MAKVPMELVKKLREMSGAGMMDCKNALEEADGDLEKAYTILREKGIAKAAKRAGRSTGQGVVEAYLHRTTPDYPPQVEVLVEERAIYQRKAELDGTPPQALAKRVDGQVENFIKETVLLEQPYFRET